MLKRTADAEADLQDRRQQAAKHDDEGHRGQVHSPVCLRVEWQSGCWASAQQKRTDTQRTMCASPCSSLRNIVSTRRLLSG